METILKAKTTGDDIIRMAEEAGFSAYHLTVLDQGIYRFAALVAAAEREACAKVCDDLVTHARAGDDRNATLAAFSCAAAIRARGKR